MKSVSLCLLLGIWTTPVNSLEIIENHPVLNLETEQEAVAYLQKFGIGLGLMSHLTERCVAFPREYESLSGEMVQYDLPEQFADFLVLQAMSEAARLGLQPETMAPYILFMAVGEGYDLGRELACHEVSAQLIHNEVQYNARKWGEFYEANVSTDG